MTKWLAPPTSACHRRLVFGLARQTRRTGWTLGRRAYSHERIHIRCGSTGHVSVDLFNVSAYSPSSPILLHLPALPSPDDQGQTVPPPPFLMNGPVASINYRWQPPTSRGDSLFSLEWPTPVHDVAFAYSWLAKNLAPEMMRRRDMYAYGSHLGASLAISLALTECRPHASFGLRGVIAYNGIYNWTMFLPDHRVNHTRKRPRGAFIPPRAPMGSHMSFLHAQLPDLFESPSNLFDPFASPALFFHNPGLLVPKSFHTSPAALAAIDALAGQGQLTQIARKPPRRSHLIFPPRQESMKIPETLLLYDQALLREDGIALPKRRSKRRTMEGRGNSLQTQAEELAELMARSVEKVELKERRKWDEDLGDDEAEAARRVQVVQVGPEDGTHDLDGDAQEMVQAWLDDRIDAVKQLPQC